MHTNKEVRFKQLLTVSNPNIVRKNLKQYLGSGYELYMSDKINKKYMIFDQSTDTMISFGDLRFEDFTKHNDLQRRERYLKRATKIKGNWINDKLSANNLAMNLLWRYDSKKMN